MVETVEFQAVSSLEDEEQHTLSSKPGCARNRIVGTFLGFVLFSRETVDTKSVFLEVRFTPNIFFRLFANSQGSFQLAFY